MYPVEKERKIRPVAYIRTDFSEKFGIPRQSGLVPELLGKIVFEEEYRCEEALREIEGFSHLWLIFDFSKAHRDEWSPTVRPPRFGGNRRIGVFASRSPFRPNSLGLSSVRLEGVEATEKDGTVLIVSGADLLDMTPIYDIKPYVPYADCHADAAGGYTETVEKKVLAVDFPEELLKAVPGDKRKALVGCLSQDPRPSYQEDEARVYGMSFAGLDVRFRVCGDVLCVVSVEEKEKR